MSILSANIEQATQRELAEQLRKEQQAQNRAQAQAERAMLRKIEDTKQAITNFEEGFKHALITKTAHWSSADLELADAYAEAMLRQVPSRSEDFVLPSTPRHVADKVNDIFTYGISLQGDALPGNVFVGQMQPWFPELLAQKCSPSSDATSESGPKADKLRYTAPVIVTEEELASPPEAPVIRVLTDESDLVEAITPRKHHKSKKRVSA